MLGAAALDTDEGKGSLLHAATEDEEGKEMGAPLAGRRHCPRTRGGGDGVQVADRRRCRTRREGDGGARPWPAAAAVRGRGGGRDGVQVQVAGRRRCRTRREDEEGKEMGFG